MARRRIFKRKRRGFNGRRRRGTRRAIRRLFKSVRKINSGIETKYNTFTIDGADIPLPGAGAIQASLCIPLQGTTVTTRIGSQIKMSRLTARWIIKGTLNSLTGDVYNTIRLMVAVVKVSNNQAASTFFGPSFFLQDVTTATRAMTSQYNWDNRKNFKILYDKLLFVQDPAVEAANGNTNLPYLRKGKVNVKLNRTVQFSANTGGSTDVEKNYLVMFAFSDSAATSHPELFWQSRVTFRDS